VSADFKAKAKELVALLARVETGEINVVEAMMAAYKMGHDDAMKAWEESMQAVIDKQKAKP
jgi:hypothetical protein